MARLNDVANIWNTVKELDVGDIREQAEQPCRIAIVGQRIGARNAVAQALTGGADRFPARGGQALDIFDVPLTRERTADLGRSDAVVLVVQGDEPLSYDEFLTYEKLSVLPVPLLLVVIGAEAAPAPAETVPDPDWSAVPAAFVPSLADAADLRKQVATALVELLPEALLLAAARRLPGLRPAAAQSLIANVSLSNATYAFTTGLPEMIPVLNLPLNAADMLVLTKNQALLVYRIALAMGADGDFSAMIKEVMPVIGGGFLWRQLARQLVGLIPVVGLLPKVAVAYAGTYATGVVAARWYHQGEMLSGKALKATMSDALAEGRRRAQALLQARKKDERLQEQLLNEPTGASTAKPQRPGLVRRLLTRARGLLPRRFRGGHPKSG
ncbi:MAG TPA: hypothetical protein VD886_09075 [Herpetosiphonaceae bacterium]|nr:hypothetical protein [Herpetosiphonaceae bacterium]